MLKDLDPRYDAVIVGARCAGASTAYLLAKSGAKVLLVDRQAYGSDTLSTHALTRAAGVFLSHWGISAELEKADTPRIHETVFHYGGAPLSIPFKSLQGVSCLYAPRRTVLDRLLVDAARKAGAVVRHGVALSGLRFAERGHVIGAHLQDATGAKIEVRADIVIGADGRQSKVAELVASRTSVARTNASGIVYGYFDGIASEASHWCFVNQSAAGVIPTNGGHCIFVAVAARDFHATFRGDVARGFHRVLAANSRDLADKVRRGTSTGSLRGFAGAQGFLRDCQGPGWALVGDAAYFKDPITAHGLTDALRDAALLSTAILVGTDPARRAYQHERDALSRPMLDITDAIASFSWSATQIQALHGELSTLMKAEAKYVATAFHPAIIAA